MKRSERHKKIQKTSATLKALSLQKLCERRRGLTLKAFFCYVGASCPVVAVVNTRHVEFKE